MNTPYAIHRHIDAAEIEAVWRQTQASIDAYWDCPFSDYRMRTKGGRVVR